MIQIKSILGRILYTAETAEDVRQAVEEAVRNKANLRSADLGYANLRSADLGYANLGYANLGYANLGYAKLADAKNTDLVFAQLVVPPDGELIAWKQAWIVGAGRQKVLVKLRIPKKARRLNATGRKCRADRAVVLGIYGLDGKKLDCVARSDHDQDFLYTVGETVTPMEPFCEDRWQECAPGIHFYLTVEEARNN